jgi:ribonuclease HII
VSSAVEIDALGLTGALRLATSRALGASPLAPDAVVVDGPMDFVGSGNRRGPKVLPVVRADETCGTVSAASVLAKVARDEHMASLANHHPEYGFERHKGYGTAAHAAAVAAFGFTSEHRRSWSFALDRVP